MTDRLEGKVARYFPEKGFGFLSAQGEEFFFHFKALPGGKINEFAAGQRYEFTPRPEQEGRKGRAEELRKVG